MPDIVLPYGQTLISASLPAGIPVDLILPPTPPLVGSPSDLVNKALAQPVDGLGIKDFKGVKTVAIAINDKTRPVPNEILLPPLIQALYEIGIQPNNISIWIASGTHTPMQSSEFPKILPDSILDTIQVYAHDCDVSTNLVRLGETNSGTPIYVNKDFYEADLKIVVGTLEPHHFMGYSGGVKTAAIGLAGRETISKNHAFLTHPNAKTGSYDTNPMRVDVEEIGLRIGVHFALNAIMTPNKQLVSVIAGDPMSTMRHGIPLSEQYCQARVNGDYPLVIASPGGHPKDINFYQAQKGLTNAACIARDSANIVLTAACPEGAGNIHYESWMKGKINHQQVLEQFSQEPFVIGPHKAYLTSRIGIRARILVISEMQEALAKHLLLIPSRSLQKAIDDTFSSELTIDRIAVLPYASTTVPNISF